MQFRAIKLTAFALHIPIFVGLFVLMVIAVVVLIFTGVYVPPT